MRASAYLALFAAASLLGLGCLAAFNYVVDPYRFFNSPDRPGLNEYRQRFFWGQTVSKPYMLRERAPAAVILGVSRAGSALAADHPGWRGASVYNFAIAGSTAYQLWRSYQHARACGRLDKLLLTLDFFTFNVHMEPRDATDFMRGYEERLQVRPDFTVNRGYPLRRFKDTLNALVSFELLHESWRTIRAQSAIAEGRLHRATLLPSGFWIVEPALGRSQRLAFRRIERQYMTLSWFPRPERRFSLRLADGSGSLRHLRRILADAYRAGIDARLAFMPFHARLAESLRAVGLWDSFERWKREVVLAVEEEARGAGRPAYPVWDFTGYNSITAEAVPPAGDSDSRMRWHLDATHVSRAAGDLMQNILLGAPGERAPDFGRRVDSRNIAGHLERERRRRERYAAAFPEDVREILETAERTAHWRKPG